MKRFFKVTDFISSITGAIGIVLIVVMLLFLIVNVAGRWAINASVNGAYEITQIMLALCFFASYSYTQTKKRHVCLSIIVKGLPTSLKFGVSAFVNLFGSAMSLFLAYAFCLQGAYAFKTSYVTTNLHLPLYPLYYVSAVFIAVFALTIFADFLKGILALAGNKEYQDELASCWV